MTGTGDDVPAGPVAWGAAAAGLGVAGFGVAGFGEPDEAVTAAVTPRSDAPAAAMTTSLRQRRLPIRPRYRPIEHRNSDADHIDVRRCAVGSLYPPVILQRGAP
jgi:hypothetical protein